MKYVRRLVKYSTRPLFSAWMMLMLIMSGFFYPFALVTPQTAHAASSSWSSSYTDWVYRKQIPVSGSVAWGAAQTNYQVPVNPSIEEVFDKTGLAGDWNFDEGGGTVASDKSVSVNHGTVSSTSAWTSSGKFNSAFSGNGSYNCSMPLVSTATDNITMEAWVYSNSASQLSTIVYNGNGGNSGYGIYIGNGSGAAGNKVTVLLGGLSWDALNSTYSLPTSTWVHLVVTRVSTRWLLYVNGRLQVTGGTTNPNTPTTSAYLGNSFNGSIDEVKIWNRALTADEIYKHYVGYSNNSLVGSWHFSEGSGTTAADSSGQGNNGTMNGSSYWTASGKAGSAFQGNGSSNYADCGGASGSLNLDGSLTIEAWIKTAGTTRAWIGMKYYGTNPYYGLSINEVRTGDVSMNIRDSSANYPKSYSVVNVNDNVWHHVVGVRDVVADKINVYVDGSLSNSITDTTTGSITNTNNFVIGKNSYASAEYFSGNIDEVKVYNRALTASEIAERYRNSSKMRDDYADLRFTNAAGTALDYWQENDSKVWVESDAVTGIPNTAAGTTFYEYYGNPSQTSASNIANTFVFGDDFDDGSISDWTATGSGTTLEASPTRKASGGYSLHQQYVSAYGTIYKSIPAQTTTFVAEWNQLHYAANSGLCIGNGTLYGDYNGGWVSSYSGTGKVLYYADAGDQNLLSYTLDKWYHIKELINPTSQNIKVYVDNSAALYDGDMRGNITTFNTVNMPVYTSGFNTYVDDVRIRKYISPEPSVGTTGAEQADITDYTYKKDIKFNTSTVATISANQNNFPIAVHINSSSFGGDLSNFFSGNSTGKRIMFFDSDETTNLPYEVEYANSPTEAIYWVKVPQVDAGSTTDKIVVAYGNDAYGADQDNPKKVWDSNYSAIWHFPNGTTLSVADSVSNNGTNSSTTVTTGYVDGGDALSGSNQSISVSNLDISGSMARTVSMWVYRTGTSSARMIEWGEGAAYKMNGCLTNVNTAGDLYWYFNTGDIYSSGTSLPASTWTQAAFVYDGGVANTTNTHIYKDGTAQSVIQAGSPGTLNTTNASYNIGKSIGSANYFAGKLDEIRVSKMNRSADWQKLEYYSMKKTNYNGDNDGSTKFITFGTQAGGANTTPSVTLKGFFKFLGSVKFK
jgi:hypothetical protein